MNRGGARLRIDPRTGRLHRVVGPVPKAIRGATLDNVAIVPASLLRRRATYQALANSLPRGQVLIVLPPIDRPQRKTVDKVVDLMRAKGRVVTTLPINQITEGFVKS